MASKDAKTTIKSINLRCLSTLKCLSETLGSLQFLQCIFNVSLSQMLKPDQSYFMKQQSGRQPPTKWKIHIQSALVISNFKGLSEIHRDTRTSTYQISRIEKKNLTSKCPKFICNLTPLHKIYIY